MGQDTLKIIAIVQARSSSSRLPNKVLKSILGTPMIIHLLKRVNKSYLINYYYFMLLAREILFAMPS